MPLICTSWLTRLLFNSRMLLGPKGWLLYSSTYACSTTQHNTTQHRATFTVSGTCGHSGEADT
jgi:hypothetical protein